MIIYKSETPRLWTSDCQVNRWNQLLCEDWRAEGAARRVKCLYVRRYPSRGTLPRSLLYTDTFSLLSRQPRESWPQVSFWTQTNENLKSDKQSAFITHSHLMTPPPGLNSTLTPVSSPIIDGPVCPLTFLLLQLLGQTPASERREREEWVGKSRIRVSGTSAGNRELLFSPLSYFFLSISSPLAVWIGLFSTSFYSLSVSASLASLKT